MCIRRTRLPLRTANNVLDVLAELSRSENVVALDCSKGAAGAACTAIRERTGEDIVTIPAVAKSHLAWPEDSVQPSGADHQSAITPTENVVVSEELVKGESQFNLPSPSRRNSTGKRFHRKFQLESALTPNGDQPKAIRFLTEGVLTHSRQYQTLHGVTGSGKTFMMANIIANVNRPTLILAPNKTLAAQLCNELSAYFPRNRVEYFVSHFKHYQPEAYLPTSDKYISKSSSIDADIDRLRHAATRSLFERSDTIVVASVSSIYGLGLPTEYLEGAIRLHVGDRLEGIDEISERLLSLNYEQSEGKRQLSRGCFNVLPDSIVVSPPWEAEGTVYRIMLDENCIRRMECFNSDSGERSSLGEELVIYPARHFVTPKARLEAAIIEIQEETRMCAETFRAEGKFLEASRLEERVGTDVDMMRKVGYCAGAENYTFYLSGRNKNSHPGPPETLLDYLPRDGKWLLFVDESHVTVPQLGAMHAGNAARKKKLIRYGFRLPSAMENRPLSAREFWQKAHQSIFVSATPGSWEIERSGKTGVVEAVIRPTGVVDPTVEVLSTKGQIENLTLALARVAAEGGRAIVTTITKKFAEDLADCIAKKPPVVGVLDRPLRVSFLHSGIDSVGRMQVLEAMRDDPISLLGSEKRGGVEKGQLDVVVGVNLLREGIDLPAVRLVAILDADSEGFLRGETALIQTIGRAARNVDGHVVMYADSITGAMHRALEETNRRRKLQLAYNSLYSITPIGAGKSRIPSTSKQTDTLLDRIRKIRLQSGAALSEKYFGESSQSPVANRNDAFMTLLNADELSDADSIRDRMLFAARAHDFETAALLRDRLVKIEAGG